MRFAKGSKCLRWGRKFFSGAVSFFFSPSRNWETILKKEERHFLLRSVLRNCNCDWSWSWMIAVDTGSTYGARSLRREMKKGQPAPTFIFWKRPSLVGEVRGTA